MKMSNVILGVMSCGGEIKRLSRSAAQWLGFHPDDMRGRPANHLFRQDDMFMIGLAGARLDRGRPRASIFLEMRRADGGYVRTRATITPRYGADKTTIESYEFALTPIV